MQEYYKSGRYFFAIAIIAFGVIQVVTSSFMSTFLPIKQSLTLGKILLYAYSCLFLICGITLMIDKTARLGARIAFFLFTIAIIYPHLYNLITDLHNPGPWSVFGETLAYSAGGLIAIGLFSPNPAAKDKVLPYPKNKIAAGRVLLASAILIFSIQHFMYGEFIAKLIPDWIPFQIFWAYLIGLVFLTASISLLLNIKTQLASFLLGFMFLFWVVCLHAPRVITNPNKETEWTSLFIALGFCGIFLMLDSACQQKKRTEFISSKHLQ